MANFDKFGFERNKEKADMSDLESRIARLEQNGMSIKNIFPIGYVFITFSSSFNPNTAFSGTTWRRVESGKMLINQSSTDNDLNAAYKKGGSKTHSHTNSSTAISIDQMPHHTHTIGPHKHSFYFNQNSINGLTEAQWNSFKEDRSIFTEYHETSSGGYWRATWRLADGNEFGKLNLRRISTGSSRLQTGDPFEEKQTYGTGGGQGHSHNCSTNSNMPPYVVCYMWERTA